LIELSKIYHNSLSNYRFIDLFAGIGGFHLALSSFGAECIFASEIDQKAAKVYFKNFGVLPEGDITKIEASEIPEHDIICGGFPCQAFSISGKRKGFEDTRGTLFFDILRIADYHKPKILFLENVKNFVKHDDGRTLKTVIRSLNEIGYDVFYKVLNASNFGLPQNRERIYFIAFRNDLAIKNFQFPKNSNINISLNDVLEINPNDAKIIDRNDIDIYKDLNSENLFEDDLIFNRPMQIGKVNKGGQGERIYDPRGHAITLSAHGGGVGSKTGLYKINGKIRKLSPRECARLQGFPDTFNIDDSQSQSYKQFGNSVAINVLQFIIIKIVEKLEANEQATKKRLQYS
jgi:DNA (cytosine-5)-methyltransferase 1